MKKRIGFFGILATIALLTATISVWAAPPAEVVQKIEDAFVNRTPCPLVSQEIKGLTVDQAYEIQAGVTKLREGKGEEIVGYFVGLADPAAQKRFGLKEPIWGLIFKSMVEGPGTLHQKDFGGMLIEPEIGFRFGKDITEPIKDLQSLQKAVGGVLPAIHFPNLFYTDMKLIAGGDLIASNVGTRNVFIGETTKVDDPNAVMVKLLYNETEITSGIGKNVLGDQWEALKWAVNDVIARGGRVKKNFVIITGVISKAPPGKPGQYVADYGNFGKISFEIK